MIARKKFGEDGGADADVTVAVDDAVFESMLMGNWENMQAGKPGTFYRSAVTAEAAASRPAPA